MVVVDAHLTPNYSVSLTPRTQCCKTVEQTRVLQFQSIWSTAICRQHAVLVMMLFICWINLLYAPCFKENTRKIWQIPFEGTENYLNNTRESNFLSPGRRFRETRTFHGTWWDVGRLGTHSRGPVISSRILAICTTVNNRSPTSHRGSPSSSPGQVMWDLWWKKWQCGRFY
jgi:hypothetical protein